jgi:hypothetical protein
VADALAFGRADPGEVDAEFPGAGADGGAGEDFGVGARTLTQPFKLPNTQALSERALTSPSTPRKPALIVSERQGAGRVRAAALDA